MKAIDFAQMVDVSRNRMLLLDKVFIDIAALGDSIKSGVDPNVYQRLDKSMGELSIVTSLLLSDCMTYYSLSSILLNEATNISIIEGSTKVLTKMQSICEYVQEFPLMTYLDKYTENTLVNADLQKMVSKVPQLTVEEVTTVTDEQAFHVVDSVSECLNRAPLGETPWSGIKTIPESLINNAYEKIGVSQEVPEMILIRFIANYASIYIALFNTLLVFKSA